MSETENYILKISLWDLEKRYGGNANYAAKAGCLKYE